jgi:hypothetical protein
VEVNREFERWRINSKNYRGYYDLIIKATYGLDSILSDLPVKNDSDSFFQSTLVLEAELSIKKIGLTIVDGDFITILPKGFSDNSLIYAPGPSVMKESVHLQEILSFNSSLQNINNFADSLLDRFYSYFPKVKVNKIKNKLVTIRNIENNSKQTDKRLSKIDELAKNFYSIRSGKVDHAIDIANRFVNLLRN